MLCKYKYVGITKVLLPPQYRLILFARLSKNSNSIKKTEFELPILTHNHLNTNKHEILVYAFIAENRIQFFTSFFHNTRVSDVFITYWAKRD